MTDQVERMSLCVNEASLTMHSEGLHPLCQSSHWISHEVYMMLLKAAKLEVCPEREKLVLLLLDEMHIREDIVYDKHSGEMIGFANLGEINEHLLAFEHSLLSNASAALLFILCPSRPLV